MARETSGSDEYMRPLKRIVAILVLFLFGFFILWRIDSPRADRLRAEIIDRTILRLDWVLVPVTKVAAMVENFQSYQRLYEQNQELRRELQHMKKFHEAARQLEQQNAKLLDLNNVRLNPKLTSLRVWCLQTVVPHFVNRYC